MLGWHEVERLPIPARSQSKVDDGDEVGHSVALSGDRIVVGAPKRKRDDGALAGAIVLRRGARSAVERELRVKGAQLGFGVGVSGNDVLVGASFASAGREESGALFVYAGSGEGSKLTGSGVSARSGLGDRIAVSGATAIVGQFASVDQGGAWVFARGDKGWREVTRLRTQKAGKQSGFGGAVALDGDRAVVGAAFATATAKQSGAVWVFERNAGEFRETAKLEPKEATEYLHFGEAVAVSGDTIVVSASLISAASIHVFRANREQHWSEVQQLAAPPGARAFGRALALSANELLVGDPQARDGAGVVWVYTHKGPTFELAGEIVPRVPSKEAWFGASIALEGTTAVIGAPLENTRAGAAYLFAR